MSDGDAWARHVDELIGAAWLDVDAATAADSPEGELWDFLRADLDRVSAQVDWESYGVHAHKTTWSASQRRKDVQRIKKRVERLLEALSDPLRPAGPSAIGKACREFDPRHRGTSQLVDDLRGAMRGIDAVLARESPTRVRPWDRDLWFRGCVWAFRNHVSRVAVVAPNLIGLLSPWRADGWEVEESRSAIWASAMEAYDDGLSAFTSAASKAYEHFPLDAEAAAQEFRDHPFDRAHPEIWPVGGSLDRPDLRSVELETARREQGRCWPLYVPGLPYDIDELN